MEFSAASDAGRVRTQNEDSFTLLPLHRGALLAVADGVGGSRAGEVASRIATRTLAEMLDTAREAPEPDARMLCDAMQTANRRIIEASSDDDRREGMGTTMTSAWIMGGTLAFAHVGDSRLYIVRDGRLQRLTEDHSVAEELVRQGKILPEQVETHPMRHAVTRTLGRLPLECDLGALALQEQDVVLLCSDGLVTALREDEVEQLLQGNEFAGIALRLIEAANAAGGPDNTTVVAVRLDSVDLEAVSGE